MTSSCAATSSTSPSPSSSARRSAPLVTAFVAVVHHAADRGDRGQAGLLRPGVHDQRLALHLRRVLQRAAVVPDHRRGHLLLRRAAAQRADGAAEARAGRRPRRAAVPGVPVGHPGGRRAAARSAPRRSGLPDARARRASRRRTRSRSRASCGRPPAARSPRRATCVVMTAGFEADGRQQRRRDRPGPGPRGRARVLRRARRRRWGLRVPEEMPWEHGRAAVPAAADGDASAPRSAPAAAVPGLGGRGSPGRTTSPAALHIDSTAFGLDRDENRRWLEPLLAAERVEFALARRSTASRRAPPTCCAPTAAAGPDPPTWPASRCCREARRRGVGAGVVLVAARARRSRAAAELAAPQPATPTRRRGSTDGSASPSCPGTIIAAVIFFFVVKPLNALPPAPGEDETPAPAPAEDVRLLTEIRDLLRALRGRRAGRRARRSRRRRRRRRRWPRRSSEVLRKRADGGGVDAREAAGAEPCARSPSPKRELDLPRCTR